MNQKRDNTFINIYHDKWNTIGLLIVTLLLLSTNVKAQVQSQHVSSSKAISLSGELRNLYDISALPAYRSNSITAQTSSYDTTGGNDDGFSGKYSYLRKNEKGDLVIFEAKGSGVLNRIWTPTPTDDTLDFYLDNDTRPTFSVRFRDLFSGNVFPFVAPLCGNELGGYYCYLPILFQKSCTIVSRGEKMQFYQVQYRLYPEGTKVKKFDLQLDEDEKAALKRISQLWNREDKSIHNFTNGHSAKLQTISTSFEMKPGEIKRIFNLNKGGRILGIEMDPADKFNGLDKAIDIKITWDNERFPAVYCPVADFFGYAFGNPSMQSLLLGVQNNKDYCYFPMPFDKKASIELIYRNANGNNAAIHLNARIYYTENKRDIPSEGKFYSHWNSRKEYAKDGPHVFLNTHGKGHYVGTVLQARGLQPGMTLFFEGDDSTSVDGRFRSHGTGSEDYFNGGWYALLDRWDTKISLPIHGSLDYSLPLARTGGYRLYLSDKISFEKSIFQSIEHGPTDNVPVDYTSLAFYYSDSPPTSFTKPTNELSKVYTPDTLMIYPQLMKFSMGGHVDFKFEGGLVITGDNGSIVRIALDDIPYGKYKLYADLNKYREGCEFSVWQRQTQLSDWISTYKPEQEHIQQLYLCDMDVKDFKNTLTLKFKTGGDHKKLLLHRLILIRIQDK